MPTYQTALHGVSLSEALAEAAAIAPISRVMLHTYELDHSSLAEPVRVVNDHAALSAALDVGSPTVIVGFLAARVRVTRPEESDTAASPNISLTIDNVSGKVSDVLAAARGSLDVWTITERIYASDDLTGPAITPPLVLTMTNVDINGTTCTLTCSFGDPANVAIPKTTFKREEYPGLSAR